MEPRASLIRRILPPIGLLILTLFFYLLWSNLRPTADQTTKEQALGESSPLHINGDLFSTGALSIDGNSKLLGDLYVYDDTTLGGTLTVGGNTILDDTLLVKGPTTLDGDLLLNGNLTVDTDTLFIDNINQRVGIGTTIPYKTLEVIGTGRFSQILTASRGIAITTRGLTILSGGATIAGSLNLNSSGITNAGSISGVTTLTLSGAVSGATSLDTINGLIINSGTLSGISGLGLNGQLVSTLATGIAPFSILSSTLVSNLNADFLDGQHGNYYQTALTNPVTGTGIQNYLVKFASATSIEDSLIYDDGANVGIGTTTPWTKLHVVGNSYFSGPLYVGNATSAEWIDWINWDAAHPNDESLVLINEVAAPNYSVIGANLLLRETSGNATYPRFGLYSTAEFTGANASNAIIGSEHRAQILGTGTVSRAIGLAGEVYTVPGSNITLAEGITSRSYLTGGTVGNIKQLYVYQLSLTGNTVLTTNYGVYIANPSVQAGSSLTNNYGIYIENPTAGSTLKYSIYSAGGTNYFAGSVGIGASSPQSKLDVEGGAAIGVAYSGTSAAPANGLIVEGSVGIGVTATTYKLQVEGSLFVNNSLTDKLTNVVWTNPSDLRLKDITGTFDYGLDELMQLNPIRYHFKTDNPFGAPTDEEHIGFIAQDVQKVLPEAVTTGADGYLRFTADSVLWTMLNSIKEQQREIQSLKLGPGTDVEGILKQVQDDLWSIQDDNSANKLAMDDLVDRLNSVSNKVDSQGAKIAILEDRLAVLQSKPAVSTKTFADNPYTLTKTDSTLKIDATDGPMVLNLPTAVGITGRTYIIKKIDVSLNAVTVIPNGTETIDGSATYSLGAQWKSVTLQSDNTNWIVVAGN